MFCIRPLAISGMILMGVALCFGCSGGQDKDLPSTISVTGVVTYQGKPVPDAQVMFYPVQGRKPASGKADASGKFQLSTFGKNDGVIPGEHKVTVIAYDSTSEGLAMDSVIPEKYTSQTSSPLTINVSEGQEEIKLDLVD